MPTIRELSDTADYLAKQLEVMEKRGLCCRCGKPLERVYYTFPGFCGEYCDKCSHELYRKYGMSFNCKDREDDDEN